jgi:hypothetical protein
MAIPRWASFARIATPIVWLCVFGYGVLRFSDGPIRPCAQGFCGKTGKLHSIADYQAFQLWEPIVIATFVIVLAIWLLLYVKSYIARF